MSLTRLTLAFVLVLLSSPFAASSPADIRPLHGSGATEEAPARVNSPIRLEGQIREITSSGGEMVIRLHRDRYPIIATHARVRWRDGAHAHRTDLQVGDSIHVEGNQEPKEIIADRITILLRIEHRGGQ